MSNVLWFIISDKTACTCTGLRKRCTLEKQIFYKFMQLRQKEKNVQNYLVI